MKKHLTFVLLIGFPIAAPEVCARGSRAPRDWTEPHLSSSTNRLSLQRRLSCAAPSKATTPLSKMLQLSTSNGIMQFTIPAGVRVRQRWHSIETAALTNLAGFRAAVRYSESGVEKTVQSVHVFGKDER